MYSLHKMKNGMDVILLPRKTMRSAAVMYCVKTGSSHEKEEIAGISHFIEHTVFRKTKNRNNIMIKKPLEEVGGSLNAFTTRNMTVFYSKVPSIEIETAIDILSDITFNATLIDEDIEKERNVILEEIAMYEDDPVDLTFENLSKNIFDEDFARPVIGYKHTVRELNNRKLYPYYKKHYNPSNTIVVVSGGFDEEKILKKFKEMNIGESGINNDFKSPILKKEDILIKKTKKELSQNYIINAFKAPNKKSEYYYPSLILNTLLGSGMSSLLFNKIREEEGLVYEIATDYNAYRENGLFLIFAATTSENIKNYNDRLSETIYNFSDRKDLNEWFNYGKKRLIGRLTIDIESNVALGMNTLDSYLTYGRIVNIDEIVEKIQKVQMEDVIEASNIIFSSNRYTSMLNPE
ncbi:MULTISPECIES: M16 family metallopeptidase [Oceanotoga]|uniref:Zn-dependent peptidase n=1 Tax=Oceanotoga teriensis TaxID=515440 RepID=A0AA45HHI4_9BACT|nr:MULTISPECIES: pitrilysin family protein [Oceanotoga]MDO7977746.1 insulinase family protein [Oceanotoga teriensis]PWJ87139.1 putative Zn-dependent peptidase [Oceanotoga teriensis]